MAESTKESTTQDKTTGEEEKDEVLERLFAVPKTEDLTKEVAGIWSWMGNTASALAEKAKKDVEDLADRTREVAESVIKTAEESREKFEHEHERFMAEAEDPDDLQARVEVHSAVLPWEPTNESSEAIKERVLKLSGDDNTFLVSPPAEVDFTFDFDANAELALSMLDADPQLNAKRFVMVPKQIKETAFWRNYFYRVNLIKEAYGHSLLVAESNAANDKQDVVEEGQDKGHELGVNTTEQPVDAAEQSSTGLDKENNVTMPDESLNVVDDVLDDDVLDDDVIDHSKWDEEFNDGDIDFDMLDENDDLLGDLDDDEDMSGLEDKIKAELNLDDD